MSGIVDSSYMMLDTHFVLDPSHKLADRSLQTCVVARKEPKTTELLFPHFPDKYE